MHEENAENGGCFECAGGWMGKYRLQRAAGKAFIPPDQLSIEAVRDHWPQITDFAQHSYPTNIHGEHLLPKNWDFFNLKFIALFLITEQMGQLLDSLSGKTSTVAAAIDSPPKNDDSTATSSGQDDFSRFEYSTNDLILYALGGQNLIT